MHGHVCAYIYIYIYDSINIMDMTVRWGDPKRSPSSLDRYQRIKSKVDMFYSSQSSDYTYNSVKTQLIFKR